MSAELPASVAPFAGRIVDADSHEQMPMQLWIEAFGEVVRPWTELALKRTPRKNNPNEANLPDYVGDVAELTQENVWATKGPGAPGAANMSRRTEVMDLMSIDRQLVYPTGVGLAGALLYGTPEDAPSYQVFKGETYAQAKILMTAYADWAVEQTKISPRVRPVTPLFGDTPEELIALAKSLIHRGIRAVQLVAGRLPGGVSPASSALDPFYAMLAEAGVPINFHIGGELRFFHTLAWGQAEAFQGYKISAETSLDPWTLSAMHLAPQNMIATMVTGGVFDRHPTLRVGVAEYTAHWIGPLADLLDLWHDNNQSIIPKAFADGNAAGRLPMRPSEYISRNVRVAPFDFEPVGTYIQKHGLEDVYCFASDYPHVEGGKNPIQRFATSLEPLGPRVLEKFFVTNGELLLPA